MLDNFPFTSAIGMPALIGIIALFVFAVIFRRPFIAIAGGVLGVLFGMGFIK